jgi:alkylation response protein AidB-like acyl-CoA dehydrogenase
VNWLENIVDAAGEDEFRHELCIWLDANVPAEWNRKGFRFPDDERERVALLRDWQAEMASGRWVGLHWPVEYGGRSATLTQQIVYNAELTARSLPALPGHRGLTIVGPTVIEYGTAEQRARFLPRIRSGQDLWAGGFSEPEAGSDLASLRTRAVIDGDRVVINGQKIWTSSAHWCDWIFTLVRTDPAADKHDGISVVLVPLGSPGITVRPIRQITGGASFNEVFFEDVVVPAENILGPVNGGWQVNRTTLSHEHFTLFIGTQVRFARTLQNLIAAAASLEDGQGRRRLEDQVIRNRIARAWAASQLLLVNGLRNVAGVASGNAPGPEGSISKLFGQEAQQALYDLAIDLAGPEALIRSGTPELPSSGRWQLGYLSARAATIGGGTSDIHRNKLAEGALGLPRDLWASEEG